MLTLHSNHELEWTPLAAAATVVGGRLVSKAAEEACSHGPEFQQKNDLYFLLRLTNEAE